MWIKFWMILKSCSNEVSTVWAASVGPTEQSAEQTVSDAYPGCMRCDVTEGMSGAGLAALADGAWVSVGHRETVRELQI